MPISIIATLSRCRKYVRRIAPPMPSAMPTIGISMTSAAGLWSTEIMVPPFCVCATVCLHWRRAVQGSLESAYAAAPDAHEEPRDGETGSLALPLFPLQREGPVGARLEAGSAR